MEIKVVKDAISRQELSEIAKDGFGDLVKAVVDVEKEIMVVGGELHADEEALLISQGSKQENLWGINFYPAKLENEWIEFDSMVNVRPARGNRSRDVEDLTIREKIQTIIRRLTS